MPWLPPCPLTTVEVKSHVVTWLMDAYQIHSGIRHLLCITHPPAVGHPLSPARAPVGPKFKQGAVGAVFGPNLRASAGLEAEARAK